MSFSTRFSMRILLVISSLLLCFGAGAEQIIIQPGPTEGKDAWIKNIPGYEGYSAPGNPIDSLRVGGWGDTSRIFVQFDIDALPENVGSAKVMFYALPYYTYQPTMDFGRVDGVWGESTVSWIDQPSVTFLRLVPAAGVNAWYEVDITDIYRDWKSGAHANYGISLIAHDPFSQPGMNGFVSSDYSDASLRPKLVVDTDAAPSLAFPILNEHPYSARISSVLDHSGPFYPTTPDDVIEAYNGEVGRRGNGFSCYPVKANKCLWGYRLDGVAISSIPGQDDGYLWYDGHSGYDYPQPNGTQIVAAADGILCPATDNTSSKGAKVWRDQAICPFGHDPINGPAGGDSWVKWAAFYIVHGSYTTWYLHSSAFTQQVSNSLLLNGYASVSRGDPIAFVGDTGVKKAFHLHFEVRKGDNESVDPYGWNGAPPLWLEPKP